MNREESRKLPNRVPTSHRRRNRPLDNMENMLSKQSVRHFKSHKMSTMESLADGTHFCLPTPPDQEEKVTRSTEPNLFWMNWNITTDCNQPASFEGVHSCSLLPLDYLHSRPSHLSFYKDFLLPSRQCSLVKTRLVHSWCILNTLVNCYVLDLWHT